MQLLVITGLSKSPKKRNTSSSRLRTSWILTLSATSATKRRSTLALCLADTVSAAAASLNSSSTSANAPCAAWCHLQTLLSELTMRALSRPKQLLKLRKNKKKSMSGSHMATDMKSFSLKTLTIATNGQCSSASKVTKPLPTA